MKREVYTRTRVWYLKALLQVYLVGYLVIESNLESVSGSKYNSNKAIPISEEERRKQVLKKILLNRGYYVNCERKPKGRLNFFLNVLILISIYRN